MKFNQNISVPVQEIIHSTLSKAEISLFIKREDMIHQYISGNKYRKLKYNLLSAEKKGLRKIVTFGGAFSNHICAVAAACVENELQAIGIIRGEDADLSNPTLSYARKCGMTIERVSRSDYRQKKTIDFLKRLKDKYGDFLLIPEGGTNQLAVKGCEEILGEDTRGYTHIFCPVGTGGTAAGIINSLNVNQEFIGVAALKGDFLRGEVQCLIKSNVKNDCWSINNEYHFGGYAKIKPNLVSFMDAFIKEFDVLLDPIYTGKMMYAIWDMIKERRLPKGAKVLAIHTGGLQGIEGMNSKMEVLRKNGVSYELSSF